MGFPDFHNITKYSQIFLSKFPDTTKQYQILEQRESSSNDRVKSRVITRKRNYDNPSKESMNRFNSIETINQTSQKQQQQQQQIQYNLPEDMRISKLLRRLCAENNPKTAIELCDKLKTVIRDPSNGSYVRKAFDILAESIISVFETGPSDCLNHVAEVFGMMGFVVKSDFGIYRGWILKIYKSQKSLRVLMMQCLLKTLKMDLNYGLTDHSGKLMEILKDYLENADQPDLFIAIIQVIEQMCWNYPNYFQEHFTDIVDIMIGWHLETEQSSEVKHHCGRVLQKFQIYWQNDLKFTLSLLGQFLEDITSCGEELMVLENGEDLDKTVSPEICFGSLVGAFNTVFKCVCFQPDSLSFQLGKEFLTDCFEKVLDVAVLALEIHQEEEMILSINEFILILLDCYQNEVQVPFDKLIEVLRIQIKSVNNFTNHQILSLLSVILKCLKELKTILSVEFIDLLLSQKSGLLKVRFTKSDVIKQSLIKINHEILNIKNVELLQRAYKLILEDFEISLNCLKGNQIDLTKIQGELNLQFNLITISGLATSNSSIIAMWALTPSILELLTENLLTTDENLWKNYPNTFSSILILLTSHCRKNNNFIASSSLLKSKTSQITDSFNKMTLDDSTISPTSEHFILVLRFLGIVLKNQLIDDQIYLIIDLCKLLISQLSQYSNILEKSQNFNEILKSIIEISSKCFNIKILTISSECLDYYLEFKNINHEILTQIAELCCVKMCSNNFMIRKKFSLIFAKIPLTVSLKQVNQFTGINREKFENVTNLQNWYISNNTRGDLRPQYFRDFIEKISFTKNADFIEDFLKEVFQNCWYYEEGRPGDFKNEALNDLRCLISWGQWEAAQFCVNNKLRTPLGKAQDTFIKIESIIKEDARILALKENSTVDNIKNLINNQKQARILLGFMECLEKVIYNASEGTAFAMPAPPQISKTFFRVNAPTCNEWFSRIRTAVDLVALHCMEPEMVIRYSEEVLKNLFKQNKINDPLFEHILMQLAWALLRNEETEALFGLYKWAKNVTQKKFSWIKMAAEQSAGHKELAANGYKDILEHEKDLDKHVRDFISDQMACCFVFTGQYHELRDLLIEQVSFYLLFLLFIITNLKFKVSCGFEVL